MQYTTCFKRALPGALRVTAGTLIALLTACGGSGMGSDAMVMGCTGGMSGAMSMCPATTVRLASPGATVNRTVQLSATPAAGMGAMVMRVDFMVDGARVGMASSAPYTIGWHSTTVSDATTSKTAEP